jgi:hypothetical protein
MWVTRSSLQSDRRRSLVANKERFFFVFSRSPTRRCSSHHHPLDGRRSPPCSRTDVARRLQRLSSAVALVQKTSLSLPSSFSLLRRHATIAHLLLLLVLVFDSRMSTRSLWLVRRARETKRDLLVVQKPVPFIY